MIALKRPLILASGSPRRKEILETMQLPFSVDVSQVDESFVGEPDETVIELSRRKAHAVSLKHPDSIILAADTLVFGTKILGKPHDSAHAKEMLLSLSGNWHSVYSGITLLDTVIGREISRADITRVHFVQLSEKEIDAYIASGDPLDKAGAYGIQGIAGMYIDKIEGSYSNVVGLPMALLRSMLIELQQEV